MTNLASIGYNGRRCGPRCARCDRRSPVLVDLGAIFPAPPAPHRALPPAGTADAQVVTGTLSCWGLCEQGEWWGLVTYDIRFGPHCRAVTHWVPAWTLRRATVA